MSDFTIIGLCGYAKSGKDTAGKRLIEVGWTRRAFADALKQDVYDFLRSRWAEGKASRLGSYDLMKVEQLHRELRQSPDFKTWESLATENFSWGDPATKEVLRPLLVLYGAGMRSIDPDYWVQCLQNRLLSMPAAGKHGIVITDVRYPNEADWIHGLGGIVIRIDREGMGPANSEEARSIPLVPVDFIVPTRTGEIESLKSRVRVLAKGLYEEYLEHLTRTET
jgi:hypothetical protein